MIQAEPRYQAFCLSNNPKAQLLTAQLQQGQLTSTDYTFTEYVTELPLKIKKTAVCDLYHENGQWNVPVILWIEAKNETLFDTMDFIPWRDAVSKQEPSLWLSINQHLNRLLGRNNVCAIVGCKESSQRFTPELQEQAYQVGRMAALTGYSVLTGGLSGVMAKAAQGADSLNGPTVGILPGTEKSAANKFIRNVFPSGIGIARNYQIALGCDVMIALNGGRGTMEEMCFALDFDKPVIAWNSWELDGAQKANNEQDIFTFLVEQKEKLILNLFDEINSSSE